MNANVSPISVLGGHGDDELMIGLDDMEVFSTLPFYGSIFSKQIQKT